MFGSKPHSFTCSNANVRGMVMVITNINTGCKAQKVEQGSDLQPSCCGGVLGSISVSPSSFFPIFLAYTCVPIPAPSTLSAGGHRRFPPLSPPPPPPPRPVSQLSPVSVMDHIWERLSYSVCLQKHSWAWKQGVPDFCIPVSVSACSRDILPSWVEFLAEKSSNQFMHQKRDEWVLVYFWWLLFQLVWLLFSRSHNWWVPFVLKSPPLSLLFYHFHKQSGHTIWVHVQEQLKKKIQR